MPLAVERRPPPDHVLVEEDDGGNGERGGQMDDARVVRDEKPRSEEERAERPEARSPREHERLRAHRGDDAVDDLSLGAGSRDDDAETTRRELVAHGCEPLRWPERAHVVAAGMHACVRAGHEPLRPLDRSERLKVLVAKGELELVAPPRDPEEIDEREETLDLVPVVGVGKETRGVRAPTAQAKESRRHARAEKRGDGVRDLPAPVHLESEVEAPSLRLREEAGDLVDACRDLGQGRPARQLEQAVEIAVEPLDEHVRPREPDERDLRVRERRTKGAEGRDGAKHVAELERADNGDALRFAAGDEVRRRRVCDHAGGTLGSRTVTRPARRSKSFQKGVSNLARVLGINAVFHDPAAALVVDGVTVAAAEEERFSRRKHGKSPVPFSTWELPEQSARWCLSAAGLDPADLDAVAYSYDPDLAPQPNGDITAGGWEGLRTLYARRAPLFLMTSLPGLDPALVRFVPHHVAHAASAHIASPYESSSVLVLDGRGERTSYLAGRYDDGRHVVLATQQLPHSLGLFYEDATEHLGFKRSSDEYKVMALASYGEPIFLSDLREAVRTTGDGGFSVAPIDWSAFAERRRADEEWRPAHANLAASVQKRLEEVLLDLARWLHRKTGDRYLTMAGGVALNCVANSRLAAEGPFDEVWVQPAAGDAGTALGAALHVARELGDDVEPMRTAALGREWSDDELAASLAAAKVAYERPADIAEAVADVLAHDGIVAWFQGRSEYGPRALGHRSLLAHPGHVENLERLNDVKGREQFRPVAPMVLEERAYEIFEGPLPSPYMLFVHRVRPSWIGRIPAVVHVDGTARIQTVAAADEPLVARLLAAFERRTGLPVVVNTSLNTAGRPIVDDPRDALECFGSAPVDALAIGPYLVRRSSFARTAA